jgi:hypothetical protein
MQAKMKYISKQIESHEESGEDGYQLKFERLQKKADKIEGTIKRELSDNTK